MDKGGRQLALSPKLSAFLVGLTAGAVGTWVYYRHCTAWWKQKAEERQFQHTTHESSLEQPFDMERALEDEILAEQFTRNVQFFGQEGQRAIHRAFVVVVGLGVGSYLL